MNFAFSIKQVLILSVVGLILVTVSSTMISTYYSTEAVLLGHAQRIMKNVAGDTISRSIDFLKPAQVAARLTQQLANHDVVGKAKPEELERYFFEQLQLYPHFSGIYFGETDGSMSYVMRDSEHSENGYRTKIILLDSEGKRSVKYYWRDHDFKLVAEESDTADTYDPRVRPWYKRAVDKKGLIWTDPYIFFSSQKPGITTASPVYDFNNLPALSGVIGVDIEISEISEFLARLQIGDSGSAFIMNSNGDVIAHPDLTKILNVNADGSGAMGFKSISDIKDAKAQAAFRSAEISLTGDTRLETNRISSFTLDDVKYQAIFAPFNQKNWPWIIGIYVPENDYLGAFIQNQKDNVALALVIGIIATVLGLWLSASISRPIAVLGEQSHQIMEGDFELTHRIDSSYKEIQETATAFSSMAFALREEKKQNTELNRSLRKTSLATIYRLSEAAEFKDHDTGEHVARMSQVAVIIAEQLGMPAGFCSDILYAAPMHDIGKIGVPDAILLKPGKLNDEERKLIMQHPQIGASILKNPETAMLKMAQDVALTHHEKWDGTGYPEGLIGRNIPIAGRICALADVFDALCSSRSYKKAYEYNKVVEMITAESGRHFDPKCVDALIAREQDIRAIYHLS